MYRKAINEWESMFTSRPPYRYREPILSAHEIYLDKKSCIRSKNEIPDKLGVCLRRYTYAQ